MNQPYKKLANREMLQGLPGSFTSYYAYKHVMEEMGSKDYYFPGLFCHPVPSTSVVMHAQVCEPLLYAEKI